MFTKNCIYKNLEFNARTMPTLWVGIYHSNSKSYAKSITLSIVASETIELHHSCAPHCS
jgi:hypothetical protein